MNAILNLSFLVTIKNMMNNGDDRQGRINNNYSIINISSVHEQTPHPQSAQYAASKGGMEMLTKTVALELADKGIRVNGIAPGSIATDMNKELLENKEQKEKKQQQETSKPVNYSLFNQKITFEFLKSYLWAAADILRSSLDPADYRQPIMSLLFIKRLNDTFEENAEKLIKEGKSEKEAYENKNRHYFFIPREAVKRLTKYAEL